MVVNCNSWPATFIPMSLPVEIRGKKSFATTGALRCFALVEHRASPEAQKLIDEHEPLAASLYVKGSTAEQEMRGKQLSVVNWERYRNVEQWMSKIVEAYGFSKPGGTTLVSPSKQHEIGGA